MPKLSLFRPKGSGNWHAKKRIPTDLRERCYGGQEFVRKSFKSSEKRIAERLATTWLIELQEEWDRKRREIASAERASIANLATEEGRPQRALSSLSEIERADLVRRLFVELEKDARERRSLDHDLPTLEAEEIIEAAGLDYTALVSGPERGPLIDWQKQLEFALEDRGIMIDSGARPLLPDLIALYRRAAVESQWRTVRSLEGDWMPARDEFFRELSAASSMNERGVSGAGTSVTICRLCDAFIEGKRKKKVAQASLDKYPMQFRVLRDFFGEARPIDSITVEEAQALADFLGTLPANATKRYPGLSLKAAAEDEAKRRLPSWISAKTQRDLFAGIAGIFRYAVELDWIERNPFGKRVVADRIPRPEKRDKPMMTAEDMTRLFSSKKFLKERKAGERGEARFWVSLLCLLHGTRTNEVCQLLVDDIAEESGIHFFHIRETDEAGDQMKQLKTSASRRVVPLHADLVQMGFLEFVEAKRTAGARFLFPALEANRRGSKADRVGKWFGRLREELFPDLPDIRGAKGLHSLRHSFTKAAELGGIDEKTLWKLGGWSSGKARNSAATYGAARELSELKAAIDKIEFPGVDFSRLYPPSS